MVNSKQSQHNGSVKKEVIVLVPGLALGGIELFFLSFRLRRLGYAVTVFYHCPFCGIFNDKTKALDDLLKKIEAPVIHFLGCSMGGLIVLDFLCRNLNQRGGKVVLLGTPVNGSLAARRVLKLPFGRFMIGQCLESSCIAETFPFPDNRKVGVISGSNSFIFRNLFRLPLPNDGLVSVQETQHPKVTDTCIFSVSHYSMIFSTKIVKAVDLFFRTGAFDESSRINIVNIKN